MRGGQGQFDELCLITRRLTLLVGISTDLPQVGTHWVLGDGWVDLSKSE